VCPIGGRSPSYLPIVWRQAVEGESVSSEVHFLNTYEGLVMLLKRWRRRLLAFQLVTNPAC